MHLFKTLLAGAALVASTVAQAPEKLAFTSFPSNVKVGTPVTVEWAGGDKTAPVTITLRKGPREDLQDVAVLTSSATGGSYTWNPSEDLVDGPDYALQISQGDVINYTDRFSIAGGSQSETPSSTTVTLSSATPSSTVAPTTSSEKPTTSSSVPSTSSEPESSTTNEPTASNTMVTTTTQAQTPPTQTPNPDALDGAAASVRFSSPLALIVGALGAFAYLN